MGSCGRLRRRFGLYLRRYAVLIIWIIINSLIFWSTYCSYKSEPKHYYLRQMLGSGLCLSRGTASVLNFSCFVVVLPMCRTITSVVRAVSTQPSMWFMRAWIDGSKGFHVMCASTIIIAAGLHSIAHIINAQNFSRYYNYEFRDVNVATFCGEDPLLMVIGTVPGVTGVAMVIILCLLASSSVKYVRASCYDLFWYTHQLFLLFLLLLLCHPLSGLLKEQSNTDMHIPGCRMLNSSKVDPEVGFPEHHYADAGVCMVMPKFVPQKTETWKWITAALAVYGADLSYRLLRRRPPVQLLAVQPHKDSVLELRLLKEGFTASPGQYILLQCPSISTFEWHPFTVTSCPTDSEPSFTVHIRTRGDWSQRLRECLLGGKDSFTEKSPCVTSTKRCSRRLTTELYVDGPFCSSTEDVLRRPISVCVAGGIGVTPFAAVLQYLRTGSQGIGCMKRLHFLWVCRELDAFCWFAELLFDVHYKLWNANRPDVLDIQLYLTGKANRQKVSDLLSERYSLLEKRVHFGRPKWADLFTEWETIYKGLKVGVFCCGPPSLSKRLKSLCRRACLRGACFSYHHESFS